MGHLEIYKVLSENLLDKNPGNQFGETPLHVAASLGHSELSKFLFDNGLEKNPRTKYKNWSKNR